MKELKDLTRDERSLLLFFECAAVDYGGLLNTAHMNSDDMDTAKKWTSEGFIEFGRIGSAYLQEFKPKSHAVKLSLNAWVLASEERRQRFERVFSKRKWFTTKELQSVE